MAYSSLRAFSRPAKYATRRSEHHLALESLEARLNLAAIVSSVHLTDDTGVSSTDKITSNATISGIANVPLTITDNVGNASGNVYQKGSFTYNPVAYDSALANYQGPVELEIQVMAGYGGNGTQIDFSFVLDNVAPTANGISDVTVNENTASTQIDLSSAFTDGSTPANELQLQVTNVSNPALVPSTSISGSDLLTLNFASWQYGVAAITIQATDLAGNITSTTFNVTVNQVPPVVSSFTISPSGGNNWVFSGTIQDSNPSGDTVAFGGVAAGLATPATVNADGSFSISEYLPGVSPGEVSAQATNAQSLASNTVWANIS